LIPVEAAEADNEAAEAVVIEAGTFKELLEVSMDLSNFLLPL
jgi:hypothetical protein